MNLASIYASIGPSGVALVFVGCAGLYLALRNLLYLHFVWRDFKPGGGKQGPVFCSRLPRRSGRLVAAANAVIT